MEIILLENVQNVGEIGDVAHVRNGYARNYLIPQKKALIATADAMVKVEQRRRQLAEEEGKRLDGAKARAEFAVKEIALTRLCGEEGQLYGSVSPLDIAEALTVAGTTIEKSEINQPDGPIKNVGQFEAEVMLHPEVRFTVKITVTGEHADSDPTSDLTSDPVGDSAPDDSATATSEAVSDTDAATDDVDKNPAESQ